MRQGKRQIKRQRGRDEKDTLGRWQSSTKCAEDDEREMPSETSATDRKNPAGEKNTVPHFGGQLKNSGDR